MTKTTATFFLLPGGPALKTQIHKTVISFVFVSLLVFPLIRQRQGRDGVCLLPASVQLVQAPLVAGRGKLQGVISVTLKINLNYIFCFSLSVFPSIKLRHSNVSYMLHVYLDCSHLLEMEDGLLSVGLWLSPPKCRGRGLSQPREPGLHHDVALAGDGLARAVATTCGEDSDMRRKIIDKPESKPRPIQS